MEKAMKIRITQGSEWYEGREGEVFDVIDGRDYGFPCEMSTDGPYVDTELNSDDTLHFVSEGDYVKVIESEESPNMVEHPPHYNFGSIEVIDFIDQITDGYSGRQAYLAGNIIKYVSRAPHKNGVEDAKKAAWYLERLINEMATKEAEDSA